MIDNNSLKDKEREVGKDKQKEGNNTNNYLLQQEEEKYKTHTQILKNRNKTSQLLKKKNKI